MKNDSLIAISSAAIQTVCGIVQTSEVFQLVQIIIGVLSGLATLAYFIIKIIRWYRKSTKDGKIDDDELGELEDIISDMRKKGE